MPSFGYFYEALEGMGIRPYDLVALREFLMAHRGHSLRISEGEGISGTAVRAMLKAQAAEKKRRVASGEFQELVWEVACSRCSQVLKAPHPELMTPGESLSPTKEAVSAFLKRWGLAPDDGWNYALAGMTDPFEPFMEELLKFVKTHRRHKLLIELRRPKLGASPNKRMQLTKPAQATKLRS